MGGCGKWWGGRGRNQDAEHDHHHHQNVVMSCVVTCALAVVLGRVKHRCFVAKPNGMPPCGLIRYPGFLGGGGWEAFMTESVTKRAAKVKDIGVEETRVLEGATNDSVGPM